MKHGIRIATPLIAALVIAGVSTAQATTADDNVALSAGQQKVATKFASPFGTLAGSQENAVALATALRTGKAATLTYTTIVDGKPVIVTETVTVPTKPMGWGNVSHALALAQYSLTQAGITQPTAADLQAALNGGKITTSDGKVVTLDGVLTQRASGMGWGQIARSEGTTMGAVNHGLKAPTTVVNASGPTNKIATTSITTAGGATSSGASSGPKGLTTAGGAPAGGNAGSKGITTASGAKSGSGIVTASGGHGGGNNAGHGVVTAGGGGGGQSADHGNGKGKGGG